MKKIFKKKGQALTEYLMVLIVGVALVSMVKTQFTEPFSQFSTALYGEDGYYTCILEVAALHDLGTRDCDKPQFSSEGGDDSFKESTYSSTPWDSQSYSSSHPSFESSTTTSDSYATTGNGTGTSFQASGSSSSLFGENTKNSRKKKTLVKKRNKNQGVDTTDELTAITQSHLTQGHSSKKQKKNRFQAKVSRDKESSKDFANIIGSTKTNRSINSNKTPRLIPVDKRPPSKPAEASKSLTFGKFIQYLMIICLILAILLFFFMQFRQIRENLKTV